jgi:hypothetical protein
MSSRPLKTPPSPRDIAAEIVRRVAEANSTTGSGYVVRLSDPPNTKERLQLLAARLQRRPIAIMPHKCETMEEWIARYSDLTQR